MKRAILIMTDGILLDILKGIGGEAFCVIRNPLPADAKPIRTWTTGLEGSSGELCMLLESESFEDIEPGEHYPILEAPVFQVENDHKTPKSTNEEKSTTTYGMPRNK